MVVGIPSKLRGSIYIQAERADLQRISPGLHPADGWSWQHTSDHNEAGDFDSRK